MKVAGFDLTESLAAGLVVALGVAVLVGASGYSFGSLSRMGPGFLPTVFGVLLLLLGLGMLWSARWADTTLPSFSLRGLITITGALLAWALLVERLGYLAATFALVVIASLAERGAKPLRVGALFLALSVLGYLIFVYGFSVPLALWPR